MSIGAAGAGADPRYVAPDGTGSACESDDRCSIRQAIEFAQPFDEVIVGPGDYPENQSLQDPAQITIHGEAGKARPRLLFSGNVQFGLFVTSGSTVRYLEIVDDPVTGNGTALFISANSVADRLIVRGFGAPNAVVRAQGATLSNSIVVSSGANARTVNTESNGGTLASTIRNVTAVATGANSTAVKARADGTELQGGHTTVNAYNVIAEGDVEVEEVGAGDTSATINMTSSAYQTPIVTGDNASVTPAGSGSNTTDAPQFVNAAEGNYRQAAGSPTIDAGSNAGAVGLFDLFGGPRKSGVVDIGAHEFVHAPLAGTGPAVNVTATTATVSANVNPRGVPTTYRFNIGTTTAYGVNTAVASAGSGSAGLPVTVPLTGLKPLTTYHYRVVATSSAGTSTGADRSFRTPPPFPGVTILKNDLALEDGRIKVKLACPAGVAPPCSGTVTLNAKKPRKNKKPATVKLGTKPFTIAAGKTKTVKVKPSDKALGKVSSLDSVKGRAMVSATDGAGQPKVTSRKVEISL